MKKLEKELQETEAVESQQKRAKLVSVKSTITSLKSTSNPSSVNTGLENERTDGWTDGRTDERTNE